MSRIDERHVFMRLSPCVGRLFFEGLAFLLIRVMMVQLWLDAMGACHDFSARVPTLIRTNRRELDCSLYRFDCSLILSMMIAFSNAHMQSTPTAEIELQTSCKTQTRFVTLSILLLVRRSLKTFMSRHGIRRTLRTSYKYIERHDPCHDSIEPTSNKKDGDLK